MLHIGRCLDFIFLPAASNDNDDLLAFSVPSRDLALIRELKYDMRYENAQSGMLLHSRKSRRFFQEVLDAEHYIVLRYFTIDAPEHVMRRLKRRILDTYLFPKHKRGRK